MKISRTGKKMGIKKTNFAVIMDVWFLYKVIAMKWTSFAPTQQAHNYKNDHNFIPSLGTWIQK